MKLTDLINITNRLWLCYWTQQYSDIGLGMCSSKGPPRWVKDLGATQWASHIESDTGMYINLIWFQLKGPYLLLIEGQLKCEGVQNSCILIWQVVYIFEKLLHFSYAYLFLRRNQFHNTFILSFFFHLVFGPPELMRQGCRWAQACCIDQT